MTGAITTNSTFDGRDVATDGTKLDGIAASANNYVHPNHSGEVTSTADGATVIADNIVDEANLKVSNSATNGQFLSAQSGNTGGLTWAAVPATSTADILTATQLTYTDSYNIGLGSGSLGAITTGDYNIAVGRYALDSTTEGNNNVSIGYGTMDSNTTGSSNVALGRSALTANTTASNNTAIGYYALVSNTTASNNAAFGFESLKSNTTGGANTGLGWRTLEDNTTGASNTGLGYSSISS